MYLIYSSAYVIIADPFLIKDGRVLSIIGSYGMPTAA